MLGNYSRQSERTENFFYFDWYARFWLWRERIVAYATTVTIDSLAFDTNLQLISFNEIAETVRYTARHRRTMERNML